MTEELDLDLGALLAHRNELDLYPITPSKSINFVQLLLTLARSLSLPTYTEQPNISTTTLSLSGRTIVIDCEFDTATGSLIKLNFNPTHDAHLESLLTRVIGRIHFNLSVVPGEGVLGKIEREERTESALLVLKRLLRELMRLDDLSSETFDALKHSRSMSDRITEAMSVDV